MGELRHVSRKEANTVMHEAVMSIDQHPPGEEQAVALLNRLATLGYSLGRRVATADPTPRPPHTTPREPH